MDYDNSKMSITRASNYDPDGPGTGTQPTPTVTLPPAKTSNTGAEAKSNVLNYAISLAGYNRTTFTNAGRSDIPSGDWCTWFLKLCGERVGIANLFSSKTGVSDFCADMIKNYGAQGYYYTDSKYITSADIAALNGAQAVTKSTFTPQVGDIYILHESGFSGMSQVGFIGNLVDGSVHAIVGNNGTNQEVQIRNSSTNTFYQINHANCPIIGYIRPNYASLDKHVCTVAPVAAKEATCTAAGNKAYYVCASCGKWYWDSGCKSQITDKNAVTIAAKGHNFGGKPSYVDGGKHAYSCANGCGVKQEAAHKGEPVAAKEATCTTAGNIAYYVCDCGAWFADSACKKVIRDSKAVVVAAKGHNFSGSATYIDYTGHNVVCVNGCGEKQMAAHKDADGDKLCDLCRGDTVDPEKRGLHVTLVDSDTNYVYTGNAITPRIIVSNDGDVLISGVDYTVKYSNNINASVDKPNKKKPRITVTGKKNLKGSTYATFDILPKDIADSDVLAGNLIVTEGTKAIPELTYGSRKLGKKDYDVQDGQYVTDGELHITGKGNFTGSRIIPVKVVKSQKKKFTVVMGSEKLTYNGSEQKQSYTVLDASSKKILTENVDYTVAYSGSLTNAGTVKFSVTGKGQYTGIVIKSYKISPLAVKSGMSFSGLNPNGYPYSAKGVTIGNDLKVSYSNEAGSTLLKEGKDYRISYSGNRKVSDSKTPAKFTVSFIGNYKGSTALKGTFFISAYNVDDTVPGYQVIIPDKIYTGKAGKYHSEPYITVSGTLLTKKDYTVKYYKDVAMTQEILGKANNIVLQPGEEFATVYAKIVFKGNYASVNDAGGYVTASYKVYSKMLYKDLSKARVTFVDDSGKPLKKVEYTGRAVRPKVKVEVKEGKKYVEVPSDQYKVVYVNNINKGKGIAVIMGTGGSCAGSKKMNFQIVSKNVRNLKGFWKGKFGASE